MSGKHKMQNAGESALGKTKETVGSATHNRSLEREGKRDKSKADAKQAGEKAKDAFRQK